MPLTTISSASIVRTAVVAAVAAAALLPASALADPTPVTAPAIPGVATLPGPIAPSAKPAASMGALKTSPDVAKAGTPFTISASGLAANKDVSLVWMTANVSWILDARPDSVDYTGRKVDKFGVVIGTAKTDANGAFTAPLVTPRDFGGIHDVFAVVDGVQVAKGGFLIERTMTVSPAKGPIGTPITIKVAGLGSPLYDSGGAIYYDNKYVGVYTGNTTRGEATFTIRAAGPVGKHSIVSGPAITVDYLNPAQSPQPWQPLFLRQFTVTKDAGLPKVQVDWPADVKPTSDAKTTFGPLGGAIVGKATASLSTSTGTILSKVDLTASGLLPGQKVDVLWGNVVGNRVNCTGQCWSIVANPMSSATASPDGSLSTQLTIPDTLGGWHAVQLSQNGEVKAQVPYFVTRSFVGVTPKKLKAGQRFTLSLKGVGWTQLDNTVAVTYDNSFVGYGCGFNSNGDVQLSLVATGEPGTHLIDLYPLLYTQNPVYTGAAGVYGMVPFLSYAQDAPGLALGYRLPAIRVAITIVK